MTPRSPDPSPGTDRGGRSLRGSGEGITHMPAEKQRLRLLLSRLVLGGANDDAVTGLLAGSAAFVVPAFDGTTAGSTERVGATITGMTACHRMVATPQIIGPCLLMAPLSPG